MGNHGRQSKSGNVKAKSGIAETKLDSAQEEALQEVKKERVDVLFDKLFEDYKEQHDVDLCDEKISPELKVLWVLAALMEEKKREYFNHLFTEAEKKEDEQSAKGKAAGLASGHDDSFSRDLLGDLFNFHPLWALFLHLKSLVGLLNGTGSTDGDKGKFGELFEFCLRFSRNITNIEDFDSSHDNSIYLTKKKSKRYYCVNSKNDANKPASLVGQILDKEVTILKEEKNTDEPTKVEKPLKKILLIDLFRDILQGELDKQKPQKPQKSRKTLGYDQIELEDKSPSYLKDVLSHEVIRLAKSLGGKDSRGGDKLELIPVLIAIALKHEIRELTITAGEYSRYGSLVGSFIRFLNELDSRINKTDEQTGKQTDEIINKDVPPDKYRALAEKMKNHIIYEQAGSQVLADYPADDDYLGRQSLARVIAMQINEIWYKNNWYTSKAERRRKILERRKKKKLKQRRKEIKKSDDPIEKEKQLKIQDEVEASLQEKEKQNPETRKRYKRNKKDQIYKLKYGRENHSPFMIHLQGPWGTGKSSLLNLIEDELTGGKNPDLCIDDWIVVHFNALQRKQIDPPWWALLDSFKMQIKDYYSNLYCHKRRAFKHQKVDFNEAKKYGFSNEYLSIYYKKPVREYIWKGPCGYFRAQRFRLATRLYRGGISWPLALLWFFLVLVLLYMVFNSELFLDSVVDSSASPEPGASSGWVASFKSAVSSGLEWFNSTIKNWKNKLAALFSGSLLFTGIYGFLKKSIPASAKEAKEFSNTKKDPMYRLKKYFHKIVTLANRPILIMIDDLDRCKPAYATELLEKIQTVFADQRVVYVVAADRQWLYKCFESEYKAFSKDVTEAGKSFGYHFLEKTFQISMAIPSLNRFGKNNYLYYLKMAKDRIGFEYPYEKARIKNKILEKKFEIQKVYQMIVEEKNDYDKQMLREIAVELLFEYPYNRGTEEFLEDFAPLMSPTPRAIKRLANAYTFQRALAILNDTWDIVGYKSRNILARWTIASLRWPQLASQLTVTPELADYMIFAHQLDNKGFRTKESSDLLGDWEKLDNALVDLQAKAEEDKEEGSSKTFDEKKKIEREINEKRNNFLDDLENDREDEETLLDEIEHEIETSIDDPKKEIELHNIRVKAISARWYFENKIELNPQEENFIKMIRQHNKERRKMLEERKKDREKDAVTNKEDIEKLKKLKKLERLEKQEEKEKEEKIAELKKQGKEEEAKELEKEKAKKFLDNDQRKNLVDLKDKKPKKELKNTKRKIGFIERWISGIDVEENYYDVKKRLLLNGDGGEESVDLNIKKNYKKIKWLTSAKNIEPLLDDENIRKVFYCEKGVSHLSAKEIEALRFLRSSRNLTGIA